MLGFKIGFVSRSEIFFSEIFFKDTLTKFGICDLKKAEPENLNTAAFISDLSWSIVKAELTVIKSK